MPYEQMGFEIPDKQRLRVWFAFAICMTQTINYWRESFE